MQHAYASDMALGRPATIERGLVHGLFEGVEADLDHAEWYGSTHKDVTAAI
jgi:hypothetical protein